MDNSKSRSDRSRRQVKLVSALPNRFKSLKFARLEALRPRSRKKREVEGNPVTLVKILLIRSCRLVGVSHPSISTTPALTSKNLTRVKVVVNASKSHLILMEEISSIGYRCHNRTSHRDATTTMTRASRNLLIRAGASKSRQTRERNVTLIGQ